MVTIAALEHLHAGAGWRNYHYLKMTTTDGVVGWAEYEESLRSPGATSVIDTLKPHVIGKPVDDIERLTTRLSTLTRAAAGSSVSMAIGAIENAALDTKARTLGIPVYSLLGGKVRDSIRVYWSHCATWRISLPQWYGNEINHIEQVVDLGAEVRESGFTALKTNIFNYDDAGVPHGWFPGFGQPDDPGLNVERSVLRNITRHLEALREGAGPDVDLLLDINFNARTEGLLRIVKELADLDMFWLEIDHDSPEALARVREASGNAISGGETLFGSKGFLPYFQAGALDVGIIDTIWNGTWQSMKMAAVAAAFEVNVAPHNYYGHLCTYMSAHFCAAVPNLRIMETDIDRIPWDDELVTHPPVYVDGHLILSDRPGWGTEPNEEAIAAHPPVEAGDLISMRK
ncbi:MAG: galactonate dehydratase [Acidimicrobiales bacterium]|jgi:galactonate dehydratase